MAHRPPQVTQADIARAIRAMRLAGFKAVRVRLTRDGAMVEPFTEADDRKLDTSAQDDEPEKVFVC